MYLTLSTIVNPMAGVFMDNKDISTQGFHVIRKDPQNQNETGLAVYVHETMSATRLTELEKYGIVCIWLEVNV